jgi:hypothetical protein
MAKTFIYKAFGEINPPCIGVSATAQLYYFFVIAQAV